MREFQPPVQSVVLRNVTKTIRTGLAACLISLAGSVAALAQTDYPSKEITLVLPFGPGGIADITARIVGNALGAELETQVVILNQPGAGGSIAARAALQAPADGYTLALLSNGTAISVPLFENLQFDPVADFVPVSTLAFFDFVFATKAGGELDSMAAVLDAARAEPGALNVGTINVGSSQNLAAELFKSSSGIEFTIIPYKATPDVLVALLADEVDVVVDSQTALKSAIEQDQVDAIASSGPSRSALLPDVATAQEEGIEDFDVTSWNAIFAPAGTPDEIIDTLNAALVEVLADPSIQEQFAELGVVARSSTPEEAGEILQRDIAKWTEVIEQAGIPKQ